ncbi:MAG: hypothetical protein H0W02_06150 [Ktedonobacteraceae bacterium]|nr:hypothetical protein [Ktedonobacteraceae bacterium]
MKRNFLARLKRNGLSYITGGLLLLVGVPLYQFLVLIPQGYNTVLPLASGGQFGAYLLWIGGHAAQYAGYRLLQMLAFALLLSLPFTLFRIIVAQEVLGREEDAQAEKHPQTSDDEPGESESTVHDTATPDGMPEFAWRGKGFAVLAAWGGLLGISFFLIGTLASTLYTVFVASGVTATAPPPATFPVFAGTFAIIANTVGGGLLAIASLFFGAMIARSGLKLWPGIWVAFGYVALALAALFSGSAVGVASAPTAGQAPLTTPAFLLFAAWVLWFGVMLVRLQPEP